MSLKNIANLLYNGFYCFEAITDCSLDDVICGVCGTIGELYLGDGNEKNCCSISEVSFKVNYREMCVCSILVFIPFIS